MVRERSKSSLLLQIYAVQSMKFGSMSRFTFRKPLPYQLKHIELVCNKIIKAKGENLAASKMYKTKFVTLYFL